MTSRVQVVVVPWPSLLYSVRSGANRETSFSWKKPFFPQILSVSESQPRKIRVHPTTPHPTMAFYEDWCSGKNGEGCCSDCSWTQIAIWTVVILVVCGVIIVLVLAFGVVRPPKATADDAVLQRFALAPADPASNSTVSYNLTATVSLRNPNMYRAIEYGPLAVTFSFNGTRFDDSATVPGFEHKARKTATVRVKVGGADKPIKLSKPGVGEFRAENDTGKFGVEMQLDTVLQYKGRSAKCPLVVICPLQLQLVDPDVAATAFQRTKCTILRAKKSGC